MPKNIAEEFLIDAIPGKNSRESSFDDISRSTIFPGTRQTEIVAVCNQKGGCGKTTTVINLGCELARKGNKVLVVDLDPQGHASLGLGVDVFSLKSSIYDILSKGLYPGDTIISSEHQGIDLIPANHLLSDAQLELVSTIGRETVLRAALTDLLQKSSYDYVVMDCSPTLNLVNINGLVAATSVLVPVQAHYYSLEGMKELFLTLKTVRERLNGDISLLGVLVTLFDGRRRADKRILEQLRDHFGELIFNTVIHTSSKIYESPEFGSPVRGYAPGSRGSREYEELAGEVTSRCSEKMRQQNANEDIEKDKEYGSQRREHSKVGI